MKTDEEMEEKLDEVFQRLLNLHKNGYIDTEKNAVNQCENNIEPKHYRKGKIDLYESWYQTRPFSEFRAIMESVAERYMKRVKVDRVEDLDKAIYTLTRLRDYEIKERDNNDW